MRHLSIAILLLASAVASASPLPEYPFVFVEGRARQELPPNLGEIDFKVWVADVKPQPALARVLSRSKELLGNLAQHGITTPDVSSYDIQQQFEDEDQYGERKKPPRYLVSRQFSVKVRKLEKWSAIMAELVGKPDVTSLSVSFARSDREALEADLELKAADDARQQGARLAQAFGRELGPAVAISSKGFRGLAETFGTDFEGMELETIEVTGARPGRVMYKMAESGGTMTIPSTVALEQRVNVLFKLK